MLHKNHVLAATNLAWARSESDLYTVVSQLTPLFVGHCYTLRVAESASVQPLSVQLVGPTGQEERLLRYAAALMALLAPMGRPPGC